MAAPPSPAVFRQLHPDVTICSRPLRRSPLPVEIGVRMSLIRLANGRLLLYNPTPMDAATRQTIERLGSDVAVIIAPSLVHHISLNEAAATYPEAVVIVPHGLAKKHSKIAPARIIEVTHAGDVLQDTTLPAALVALLHQSEIALNYLPDFVHQELVLFHRPSSSLLVSDLISNLQNPMAQSEQYRHAPAPTGLLQRWAERHMHPGTATARRMSKLSLKTTSQALVSLHTILEHWQPQRIITQHGDVIDSNGINALLMCFDWVTRKSKYKRLATAHVKGGDQHA